MKFEKDEFPIRDVLIENRWHIDYIDKLLKEAKEGGIAEKYRFAAYIHYLVANIREDGRLDFGMATYYIRNFRPEVRDFTFQQCLSVFREAAEAGYPEGALMMAYCCKHGQGCEKNPQQAALWLEKLEKETGFPNIQTEDDRFQRYLCALDLQSYVRMGFLYNDDDEIKQACLRKAFALFKEGALDNNEQSEELLAYSYALGLGCEQDLIQAKFWMEKTDPDGLKQHDPCIRDVRALLKDAGLLSSPLPPSP